MDALAIFIATVVVLTIVVLFTTSRGAGAQRRGAGVARAGDAQVWADLAAAVNTAIVAIKAIITNNFTGIGNIPVEGRGTLNNLRTGDLITGSGRQEIDVKVGTIVFNYRYSVGRIHDLFANTRVESIAITINADNSVDVVPVIAVPRPWAEFTLTGETSGVPVASVDCTDSLALVGAKVVPTIRLTVSGCPGSSYISKITLTNLAIRYADMQWAGCSVRLIVGLTVKTVSVGDIAGPIREKLGALKGLAAPYVDKDVHIPFPCLYVPASVCFPRVRLSGGTPIPFSRFVGLGAEKCLAVCRGVPGCTAATYLQSGNCTLAKKVGTTVRVPASAGAIYYTDGRVLKGTIPTYGKDHEYVYPYSIALPPADCSTVCRTPTSGCSAYASDLATGACANYSGSGITQQLTTDVAQCARSLENPFAFNITL